MAFVEKWNPGPTAAEEHMSLGVLRDVLEQQMFGQLVRSGSSFPGAPIAGYLPNGVTWFYNGGMPYFAVSWYAGGGNGLTLKIRYDAALAGMLDPFTWFPGVYSTINNNSQADVNSASADLRLLSWPSQLMTAINSAGLARSGLGSVDTNYLTYGYGPRAGQVWGVRTYSEYNPNLAEQEDGIVRSSAHAVIGASDAFDGTIGVTATPAQAGQNYSQTPQLIATQPDQQAAWDDIKPAIDSLKPSIDNNTGAVEDLKEATDKLDVPGRGDTVSNAGDVGQPGDTASPTPIPGVQLFAAPGALPALVANPTGLALISKIPALLTACVAAVGVAAATVTQLSWLTSLKQGAEAALTWLNPLQQAASAQENISDSADEISGFIERVAIALEAIQGEIVRDPEDPLAKPGLINVVELASQARTELEVRTNGQLWIASTGTVVEE